MSPDPSGMAAVSLANPQSLNMYAYVTNNPTNFIDALGLDGYGPGSNACTSTSDTNGQTQCQAATYAAAMAASNSLPAGCSDAMEYGCGGTPSENAVAEGSFANAMNVQFLSQCGKCSKSGTYTIGGTTYSYVQGETVSSAINGAAVGSATTPGRWEAVQPCFGGDVMCDSAGNVVHVNGNIESDNNANFAIAGAVYAVWDVGMVQGGRLFGTGYGGNAPVFNSNDYLRVGWSYIYDTGEYGFRVAGEWLDYLTGQARSHIWIWGGPP